MNKNLLITLIVAGAAAAAGYFVGAGTPATAPEMAQSMPSHEGMTAGDHMQMMKKPAGVVNDSTKEFQAANVKMHTDMAITFTGDADVDFITGMIPHHQGAIDMARVVLKHGHDAEIKKLAEGIITAQESEIAMMKEWLVKNPH